ncbi:unnamed protein product [Phaeothamnion confervicola]
MPSRRKEIYTYEAPWTVFSMGWSQRQDERSMFRLALGSYKESYNNQVQVPRNANGEHHPPLPFSVDPFFSFSGTQIVQRSDYSFNCLAQFDHPYPPTKIMWSPDKSPGARDLLATTGDYLRLWSVGAPGSGGGSAGVEVKIEATLNNNKSSEYCSPLTSFDWCDVDPTVVGTSSTDTTCTIWDVATGVPKTQLIAHDKEVYDLAFSQTKEVFASVGADGSVRMFDLRQLEHSTIIYETADLAPLLRLAWNKQDANYLAALLTDSAKTVILDIRVPSLPVAELGGHGAAVNAVAWAPHSSCHVCTAGDDAQALIWDLSTVPKPVDDPILAYSAEAEINQLQWAASHSEWIGIAFRNKMQILRV